MRARNGNLNVTTGTGNDVVDFSVFNEASGPNGVGYGVNYTNRGGSTACSAPVSTTTSPCPPARS